MTIDDKGGGVHEMMTDDGDVNKKKVKDENNHQ